MTNIVTGKAIDAETATFLIDGVRKGVESYSNFRTTRLLNKTKKLFDLFDPIQKINKIKKSVRSKQKD